MKNHVQIHMSKEVKCDYCGTTCKNMPSLKVHISQKHRQYHKQFNGSEAPIPALMNVTEPPVLNVNEEPTPALLQQLYHHYDYFYQRVIKQHHHQTRLFTLRNLLQILLTVFTSVEQKIKNSKLQRFFIVIRSSLPKSPKSKGTAFSSISSSTGLSFSSLIQNILGKLQSHNWSFGWQMFFTALQ